MNASSRYRVQVQGLGWIRGPERKVVFHGVNKSGSLVMTNLLYHGYYETHRANQFFSTYRNVPPDQEHLRTILVRSTGHSFFGGHYLYGSFPLDPQEHVLTTQFRNPLPRTRSCYQWLYNKAAAKGESFPGFEEWVVSTRGVAHSQVAQFGVGYGPDRKEQLRGLGGAELLAAAKENIARDVRWFGIAELFEESAFCMAAICGIPAIRAWQRDDRNANRPLVDEWPEEHLALVRDVYRWDFELYEWALGIFHERLERLTFGPELERYKDACRSQYKDRLDPAGNPL